MNPPSRVTTEGFRRADLARAVEKAALSALLFLRCSRVRVNIYCVTPERARTLNRVFRKKDEPAGVLSFASPGPDPEGERGEILICVEGVQKLAAKRSRTLKGMLSFMTVHGVLHVLGFHHGNSEDAEIMSCLERAIESSLKAGRGASRAS